ncbi:MAG TPA: mechanosensitive ion channel domain-containing protein [Candidatus Saccharimonadia bacterium]|jgi:small-conductance mechanosensitive channel|nr:mechanosensitive ion channel domain-containing protein [Candidatus Saccharimonadia bacterium]
MFELNSTLLNHILTLMRGLQVTLLPTLFDFLVGVIVIRFAVRGLRLLLKFTQVQTGMRYVLTSIVETTLWIILTAILLQELGFSGVIYFFTGSIAAIGIAMAAGGSTLVSDIVAAIFLARDKDFNIGDEVIVGWEPRTQGIIERMDARRIRLRDADGQLHVIPNSTIERREWIVISKRAELSALTKATKAAKRIGAAALDKRPTFRTKSGSNSENDQ